MNKRIPYKRILLKLSGETLMGQNPFGIHQEACNSIAKAIKGMRETGVEVAIVIGGGNIFRGINLRAMGMERTPADHMGMLATLVNGIALQQALHSIGCPARVMSALECPQVADNYNWTRALELITTGNVLIFVGGTGNPYFTTDSAAALRANEIHADILLKATKVDGIYNKDPIVFKDAVKYDNMNYSQILAEKLEVMDATAIALCRSNHIPIFVFNMNLLEKVSIDKILTQQEMFGTIVKGD